MGAVLCNHRTGEIRRGHGETPEEWGVLPPNWCEPGRRRTGSLEISIIGLITPT